MKGNRGFWIIAACVLLTFVGRIYFPTRPIVITETYTHFAHITIGMLFVLSYQGRRWATFAWVGLTVFEVLVFLCNKPGGV